MAAYSPISILARLIFSLLLFWNRAFAYSTVGPEKIETRQLLLISSVAMVFKFVKFRVRARISTMVVSTS